MGKIESSSLGKNPSVCYTCAARCGFEGCNPNVFIQNTTRHVTRPILCPDNLEDTKLEEQGLAESLLRQQLKRQS